MDLPKIYLRTGAPAFRVATELVRRLGFRLVRTLDRQPMVSRPMTAAPSGELGMRIDEMFKHLSIERLSDGYDIELTVNPEARDPAVREAEVWRLYDEVRERLGYPALLTDSGWMVAVWSPDRELWRFPPRTFGDREDKERWQDYALPPAARVPGLAPEDELGQLYARIVADPDDDGLRLAYADAVAEEHPEYAELIRLQVADTARRAAGTVAGPAKRRMNELERRFHRDIVPWQIFRSDEDWQIRRGFVEAASPTAARFVRDAARLVAGVPLRMLYVSSGAQEQMAELAAVPELARLRGLSFWGNPIGDEGLHTLLSSPYLTGLRWLSLARTGVSAAGIEELAASDAVPNLRYVRADDALRLNPRPVFDYNGSFVDADEPLLALRLARSYDRPWLRWAPKSTDQWEWDPEYDAV